MSGLPRVLSESSLSIFDGVIFERLLILRKNQSLEALVRGKNPARSASDCILEKRDGIYAIYNQNQVSSLMPRAFMLSSVHTSKIQPRSAQYSRAASHLDRFLA